jgi:Alw26I/Eco31I/Esp3I family type II restriction m6 adenine DNA methyltransferase
MNIKDVVFEKLKDEELKLVCTRVDEQILQGNSIVAINENLHISDASNLAFQVHKEMVNSLARIYIKETVSKQKSHLLEIFLSTKEHPVLNIVEDCIKCIPELCERLHISFLNSKYYFEDGVIKREFSKHYLKNSGSVYTPKKIANDIVSQCIKNVAKKKYNIESIKCLDFASGTGVFYFEAINILNKKYEIQLDKCIINLYAVDSDEVAISVLRLKIIALFSDISESVVRALTSNIICKNVLHIDDFYQSKKIEIFDCQKTTTAVFDVVFSNPPYLVLKVNKKNNSPELASYYDVLQKKIKLEVDFFRKSNLYNYSIQGMLNYYQLSIEMIIKLTKSSGQIGVICPSSLFGDASASKLRKHILEDNGLLSVDFYTEKDKIFNNVTQATSIFFMEKGGITKKIKISLSMNSFEVDFNTIKTTFSERLEVLPINQISWSILSKISKNEKLKDVSNIRNRRGELDLSLFRDFITQNNTGHALVRGHMVSNSSINYENSSEFIDIERFLKKKSQDYLENDFGEKRLVCQQISNASQRKRVNFVWSNRSDIIANSCNYLSGNSDFLSKLRYILNSSLIDWRFKLTSTNNHINNYEIDDFPIIDLEKINVNKFSNNDQQNDSDICSLYGLSLEETKYIVKHAG